MSAWWRRRPNVVLQVASLLCQSEAGLRTDLCVYESECAAGSAVRTKLLSVNAEEGIVVIIQAQRYEPCAKVDGVHAQCEQGGFL